MLFTKFEMDLNNRKTKNHPPSPVAAAFDQSNYVL